MLFAHVRGRRPRFERRRGQFPAGVDEAPDKYRIGPAPSGRPPGRRLGQGRLFERVAAGRETRCERGGVVQDGILRYAAAGVCAAAGATARSRVGETGWRGRGAAARGSGSGGPLRTGWCGARWHLALRGGWCVRGGWRDSAEQGRRDRPAGAWCGGAWQRVRRPAANGVVWCKMASCATRRLARQRGAG